MSIILNVTSKHHRCFSVTQKLACREYSYVIDHHVTTIEEFDEALARCRDTVDCVIVDPDNIVLNNDIMNTVTCNIVTLDVEIFVDEGTYYFKNYDPDESL